jgi:hypothetical protein
MDNFPHTFKHRLTNVLRMLAGQPLAHARDSDQSRDSEGAGAQELETLGLV